MFLRYYFHIPCSSLLYLLESFTYLLISFSITLFYSQAATWTDNSGKYSVEGEFEKLEGGYVVIKRTDGKRTSVPLEKLDKKSQDMALSTLGNEKNRGDIEQTAILDAKLLEKQAKKQRSAKRSLELYKHFLDQPNIAFNEKRTASKKLVLWQDRAENDLWRWGKKWIAVDQIENLLSEEENRLKEAHRLIEIGNNKLARERFEQASSINPEGIRGDFYLGVLHLLIGQHPENADKCFTNCIRRIEKSHDRLAGSRRSNLIAAYNNRAICRVRLGKHNSALKDWSIAIRMAPMTPELVQNLGYYAKLASIFTDWGISKSIAKRIANTYADVTVKNQSNAFQENIGWLLVPYVDAPQLPSFVNLNNTKHIAQQDWNAESDTRVIDWATSLAVSNDCLVTSLSAVKDSYGLLIYKDNQLNEDIPGKIIAKSSENNLALLQFAGLDAKHLFLSNEQPKRAVDVIAISFPEPGILGNNPQSVEGTILDVKSIGILNNTAYTTKLIHDIDLSEGSYGSPLIDAQGKVVGIDQGVFNLSEGYRSAVSSLVIRNFLLTTNRNLPAIDANVQPAIGNLKEFILTATDKSVFSIAIVGRVPRLSWSDRVGSVLGIKSINGWNGYEDRWCTICDGLGNIPCNARDCVKGQISIKETYIQGRMPITNDPIYAAKWHHESCRTCNGKGVVTCPHCKGRKIEPTLR